MPGEVIAYVGVGSNIAPEEKIPDALDLLLGRLPVLRTSTFYRSAPVGRTDQPCFVNGVWEVRAPATARELKFEVLRPIEARLGRRRSADRNAPRPIDLDVIIFGDEVHDSSELRLPDPEIWLRPFLARPLVELAPDLILPGSADRLGDLESARPGPGGGLEALPALTVALRARLRPP